MTLSDIHTHIRISLSLLGRDPYVQLPRRKAAAKAMMDLVHIECRRRGLLREKKGAA